MSPSAAIAAITAALMGLYQAGASRCGSAWQIRSTAGCYARAFFITGSPDTENTRLHIRLATNLNSAVARAIYLINAWHFSKLADWLGFTEISWQDKDRNLRRKTPLFNAIVNQCINFVGFIKNCINTQLGATLTNVVGGIVAQYHDLLQWIPAATSC